MGHAQKPPRILAVASTAIASPWPGDVDRIVSAWQAAWNGVPASVRHRHLLLCWGAEAVFCDPMTQLRGIDALDSYIGAVRRGDPGLRFELVAQPEAHHGSVYFRWRMPAHPGRSALDGSCFALIGADGRFDRVISFFSAAAEPAPPDGGDMAAAFDSLR